MSSRPIHDVQPDGFFTETLREADSAVADAIAAELDRQQNQIELIASENIVSRAVLEAQGSVLTNKYAEGYPGRRYYQGCAPSDSVENLAIERARQLFGCGFANVQPHSGAQANGAVMMALLKPGDTIMGMSLAAGGHLTHGHQLNFSGKTYKISGKILQGIEATKAKEISKTIRDEKLKGVQAQIQGDQLRVSGKKKDDLQAVIALLKGKDFGIALQFVNYR